METTTPIDLNRAIQHWRENLAQSPAIRGDNLNELESHLRDSIATLQKSGLSAEEAFLVATKRVGNGATLGVEFDPDAAWNERKHVYETSNLIIGSTSITAYAEGDASGRWTCAVAATVFRFA